MDDELTRTIATYDEVASEYWRRRNRRPANVFDDLDEFRAALPERGWVADVGCGPGQDVDLLRAEGLRVVGVDLSFEMLRAGGVSGCVQGDMRRLPLADRCLRGIWCHAALLHVARELVPAVLAEFARVLLPDGMLHLSISEGEGEGWESGAYGSSSARWFVHHPAEAFEQLLGTAGFAVLDRERTVTHRSWLRLLARSQD